MMAPRPKPGAPWNGPRQTTPRSWQRARGVSRVEVVWLVVVLALVCLVVLASLPRQRENARLASCQRNLMQIGAAIALYDGIEGRLPGVPALPSATSASSPLAALLETLQVPDFKQLQPNAPLPKTRSTAVLGERPIPGFTCPSDPHASATVFPAPVSYRATAGDQHDGQNGGFAPGRLLGLADIDTGDGLSYTAAFAERLTGHGKTGAPSLEDYALVPGPLSVEGCPTVSPQRWQGDAGKSWTDLGWRSTLYNHALPPDSRASCVSDDGRSALMGASSGHTQGVNVLNFDGSVRTVRPTIAPPIWKALATTRSPGPEPR